MTHRPILLPDVSTFEELLEYHGEWSHAFPREPQTNATIAPVDPRYIHNAPDATAWEREAYRSWSSKGNEIGPYCSVDLSQLGGARHRGIVVRATDRVLEVVAPRIVTPDDHLSFSIIGHKHTGRALVILQHGYIIGSHWLAEIDPATIPAYPYSERDRRVADLVEVIRGEGMTPVRRDLEHHAIELRPREDQRLWVRVSAGGSVTRRWADGTISHA